MTENATAPDAAVEDLRDPYEIQAEAQKKALAEKPKKKAQKDMPGKKNRVRKYVAKAGKERPCGICGVIIAPNDPRTKYCLKCGKEVAAEAARTKGGRPPMDETEVRLKLRPWLKMGLNLKQACFEAEIGYQNLVDKKKNWDGFDEFVAGCKEYAVIKAKRNLSLILNDPKSKNGFAATKFVLETLAKDEEGNPEFSKHVDVTTAGKPVYGEVAPEKKSALEALLSFRL